MNRSQSTLPIAISFLAIIGCATQSVLITPDTLNNSQIEIAYVLGHTEYKYIAKGDQDSAEVSSYRADQLVEKKKITLDRHREFAAKLEEVLRSSPSNSADENCRTPYRIQITTSVRTSTTTGCRSADTEGQIGQILKEGEFIFYSTQDSEIN